MGTLETAYAQGYADACDLALDALKLAESRYRRMGLVGSDYEQICNTITKIEAGSRMARRGCDDAGELFETERQLDLADRKDIGR